MSDCGNYRLIGRGKPDKTIYPDLKRLRHGDEVPEGYREFRVLYGEPVHQADGQLQSRYWALERV